jgi:hypothetical protein
MMGLLTGTLFQRNPDAQLLPLCFVLRNAAHMLAHGRSVLSTSQRPHGLPATCVAIARKDAPHGLTMNPFP